MKREAATSELLLAFLRDPHSYSDHPRRVVMLQTHASWLFVVGRHVFKVKKPVNLGFLDFSTLDKRRHFCEREVTLNRRLCPDTYLGVVPITRSAGRFAFDGDGEIVEYAVKMRRLPERHFMLARMARGEITMRDVDAIAATLARFYEAQEPTSAITAWGRVAKLRISTCENFRQMRRFIGATITRPAFEAIRVFTEAFYRSHTALFASRIRERRIRDCHGDLHLEHIHISPRRLTIFDCIEFNERFRYIDVANDVAFLAMDFDVHNRPDFARHFASRIAHALSDPGLLRLLDFYKCYRACVRGKVESLHEFAAGVPDTERRESQSHAEHYFRLALRYAVSGSAPLVLIVMGRVGSGKSTLARALGRELGWEVFSSDRIRKELAGAPLHERGSERERRRLYSKAMSDRTYAALARHALDQVRLHRGVILDATFASRQRRAGLRKTLDRARVDYTFVEAQAGTATLRKRLAGRAHATNEISDARLDDFPMLDRLYESPTEVEPRHLLAVKTTRTDAAVMAALKALALRHASNPAQA